MTAKPDAGFLTRRAIETARPISPRFAGDLDVAEAALGRAMTTLKDDREHIGQAKADDAHRALEMARSELCTSANAIQESMIDEELLAEMNEEAAKKSKELALGGRNLKIRGLVGAVAGVGVAWLMVSLLERSGNLPSWVAIGIIVTGVGLGQLVSEVIAERRSPASPSIVVGIRDRIGGAAHEAHQVVRTAAEASHAVKKSMSVLDAAVGGNGAQGIAQARSCLEASSDSLAQAARLVDEAAFVAHGWARRL